MLHEKYAEQNNVTIASNTTFDLQYERTCLRTHTAIDCSFIAGWHLLLPTGAWTKTTTTSFHTHHFVTAVREKSPKFKSFRFIMNPIPEKKKKSTVLSYWISFACFRCGDMVDLPRNQCAHTFSSQSRAPLRSSS